MEIRDLFSAMTHQATYSDSSFIISTTLIV